MKTFRKRTFGTGSVRSRNAHGVAVGNSYFDTEPKLTHHRTFGPLPAILLAILALSALTACASDPPPNPLDHGEKMLPPQTLGAFSPFGDQMQLEKLQIVPVDHPKFNSAIEVQTQGGARVDWNTEIVAPVTKPVKRGDVLLAHFWLRCTNSMTGEGYTSFEFELNHGEYDKAVDFRISAEQQWKEVFVPFEADRDFPLGEARICFRTGFDQQTIQLGGIELLNFHDRMKLSDLPATKITYAGRDPNAQWRKDALARIEKIRKGNLDIYVTDSDGRPIEGATAHAVLRRHAFGFGTCVDASFLTGNTPDDERYRQTVLSLFNRAVFENDMKWPEIYDGVPPMVDQSVKWLLDHHFKIRGHNLIWPSWQWMPPQLEAYAYDPKKLREIIAKHITDTVTHFRGQMIDWDVVNEPFTNYDLFDDLGMGAGQLVVQWYQLAHQADPDCRLFLNDFGILDGPAFSEHRENFSENISYLKENGAPLGGIGIQSHFGTEIPPPENIIKILDRFSKFNLPIELTEVSINLQDRQLQADYLRDYMIACFSEPRVEAIMMWGFWAGRHWRPEAALYDLQWNIRPIGQTWIDLTQKQWTTDATATTDSSGVASVRGFYGTYEITITTGSKQQTLTTELKPGGSRLEVHME